MTKKDYEAIAAVFKAPNVSRAPEALRQALAKDLAAVFKAENPRFDAQRFLQACGVPQ